MPHTRPRSYVGLLAAALGGALFLLVHPAVELDGHLRTVRDGDPAATREALRRLCWLGPGVAALNQTLPELESARRAAVLREAQALGCLTQLTPSLQATYYLFDTEDVERVVGFTAAAVEPALEVLASGDADQRWRAARALSLLDAHWSFAQRTRIEELLTTLTPGRAVEELRGGMAGERAKTPPAEVPVEPPEPPQEEITAGEPVQDMGLPDEPLVPDLVQPTLVAPRMGVLYRQAAAPQEEVAEAVEDPADMGDAHD